MERGVRVVQCSPRTAHSHWTWSVTTVVGAVVVNVTGLCVMHAGQRSQSSGCVTRLDVVMVGQCSQFRMQTKRRVVGYQCCYSGLTVLQCVWSVAVWHAEHRSPVTSHPEAVCGVIACSGSRNMQCHGDSVVARLVPVVVMVSASRQLVTLGLLRHDTIRSMSRPCRCMDTPSYGAVTRFPRCESARHGRCNC